MAYGEITSIELQNLEVLNTKSESGFKNLCTFPVSLTLLSSKKEPHY